MSEVMLTPADATVTKVEGQGMITLRGDLGRKKLRAAVKALTKIDVPDIRGITTKAQASVAWMSPDELLILVPKARIKEAVSALSTALAGDHALVADVSDARAVFTVAGPDARDTLAKLCPVDLALDRFSKGEMRRTRMAQVPAAFWLSDESAEEFTVVVFRSVGQYAYDLLQNAANSPAVGFHSAAE
ncbi:sarcosine oxidase subunit gamma [Halocynthiibacter sp. C4]|uniref:sarcosine oxidase subunit gamma n=1 Tax=Halocynthiibacter sp. C4 TaxID=2992758 RepID=UPI00237A2F12|nr:sarcosine oxidase subunit gamma family protein [Halocynthiibacter sp. C4]MDE0589946.1 sarcosine oxidase subunit gamma [Halocynthiibacter sp. C4]